MMRKRSSGQNNYGHQKRRNSHSGGGHNNSGGNRPRKNYTAMREKYMSQARDALASGDRVMAEYFYQHADHCFRMMMEEGHRQPRPQQAAQAEDGQAAEELASDAPDMNTSQLPAFITSSYDSQAQKGGDEPQPQNWEERDA